MRRSERLIERGLEFRSRQEAAGGRRQNPAWSRPPPPPPRTRTPPHGAAAAMASPSRSRSRSPRARRPPRGLTRAAPVPSPRAGRRARDPRPSQAPSPSGHRCWPGPVGALEGSWRGIPGPRERPRVPLTWVLCLAPGGRFCWLSATLQGPRLGAASALGAGAETAQLSLTLLRDAAGAEPPRPPARAPTQRCPGQRRRSYSRCAGRTPSPCTPAGLKTNPIRDQAFHLGESEVRGNQT